MISAFEGIEPRLEGERIFVAPGAAVIGDVILGEDVGIWFNTVLRGDIERITVGSGSNVQDGSILHTDTGKPCVIGEGVTIGHNCVIHGCEIGDRTLIGMGAVVLTGARVGRECIIGAGALVTGKSDIPDGTMAVGAPARVIRKVTDDELEKMRANTQRYIHKVVRYLREGLG